MDRIGILAFAIVSYCVGLAGLVHFVLFAGGVDLFSRSINAVSAAPVAQALAANLGLLALFALQHSGMARQRFKRAWARLVPSACERSAYVFLSGLLLLCIVWFWQPLPGTVWRVEGRVLWTGLVVLQVLGWSWALAASLQVGHFEVMGIRQAVRHFHGKGEGARDFTDRFMYRLVRHPQQFGALLGLWSTPWMSTSHLMLSGGLSAYVLIALRWEERDLLAALGRPYEEYRRRVRMIVPIPRRAHRESRVRAPATR